MNLAQYPWLEGVIDHLLFPLSLNKYNSGIYSKYIYPQTNADLTPHQSSFLLKLVETVADSQPLKIQRTNYLWDQILNIFTKQSLHLTFRKGGGRSDRKIGGIRGPGCLHLDVTSRCEGKKEAAMKSQQYGYLN